MFEVNNCKNYEPGTKCVEETFESIETAQEWLNNVKEN